MGAWAAAQGMNEWCQKHHHSSGLVERCRGSKVAARPACIHHRRPSMAQPPSLASGVLEGRRSTSAGFRAEFGPAARPGQTKRLSCPGLTARTQIPNYPVEHPQALLAGNTCHNDLNFLRVHMPRLASHLSYRICDVSTVMVRQHSPPCLSIEADASSSLIALVVVPQELAKRWFPREYYRAPRKVRTQRNPAAHHTRRARDGLPCERFHALLISGVNAAAEMRAHCDVGHPREHRGTAILQDASIQAPGPPAKTIQQVMTRDPGCSKQLKSANTGLHHHDFFSGPGGILLVSASLCPVAIFMHQNSTHVMNGRSQVWRGAVASLARCLGLRMRHIDVGYFSVAA